MRILRGGHCASLIGSGRTEACGPVVATRIGLAAFGRLLARSLVVVGLCIGAALAEGTTAHGAEAAVEHHGPSMALLWLNFVLYVLAMYGVTRKPAKSFWDSRKLRIGDAVARASALLQEARIAHAQVIAEESELDSKLAIAREELIASAEAEYREVVDSARDRASRLLNQARQLVEAERNRRLDAIRREFASRVVAHAEQILRGQVDVEVDKALRGAALENEKGIGMLTS